MLNYAAWARGVLVLSVFCHAALLWRLRRDGLAKIYPFLTLFLGVDLAQSLFALPFRSGTAAYRAVLMASSPVLWLLSYFVVVELYRLILEDYPGIASAGRKAVSWSLILAVAISGVSVLPSINSSQGQERVLYRLFFSIERSVILGQLVFLVLIQLILARYRLQLARNRVVYLIGYALFFGLAMAIDVVATGLFGVRLFGPIDIGMLVVANLVLLSGAFLLSREGEVRAGDTFAEDSARRTHLQQQLADMNRFLSRAARGS